MDDSGFVNEFFWLLMESSWWIGCQMDFFFYFTLNQTFKNIFQKIFRNTLNIVKTNIFQRNKQNINVIYVRAVPLKVPNL